MDKEEKYSNRKRLPKDGAILAENDNILLKGVLIFSVQTGWRPPGAIFFLLRRRKNMERKTPRRAGCSPPYGPTPLGGCRGCSRTLYQLPGRLVTASVVRPGVLAACRCACAYDAGC